MAKNKITLNVLSDVSRKINGGRRCNSNNKALIVFTGSTIGLDERIKELQKLKEKDIQISLGFSFMAERILDTNKVINSLNPIEVYKEENIFSMEKILEDYFMLIGPNITMNSLSKVSLGMVDSFVPNMIWSFLYMGKDVYLDFTSVTNYMGVKTKNIEINNVIENHIHNLKNMGVVEIEEGKYLNRIINTSKVSIVENKVKGNDNFNKVITERDLINYSSTNKSMILPKGTIITPLAKDRARELGIQIEVER